MVSGGRSCWGSAFRGCLNSISESGGTRASNISWKHWPSMAPAPTLSGIFTATQVTSALLLSSSAWPATDNSGERWNLGWKLKIIGLREVLCSPPPSTRNWILIQMMGYCGRNVKTVTWSGLNFKGVVHGWRQRHQLIGNYSLVSLKLVVCLDLQIFFFTKAAVRTESS